MYSVLYWLNLSLAKMLKGWLQCKSDDFVVGFQAKRQVDMTCFEQKVTIKIPCYHLGRRYFFIKGKFDITSGPYVFPNIFYSIFFIEPSYEDKPTYSACQGWLNCALCFLERFLKVLFIFFFSLQSFYCHIVNFEFTGGVYIQNLQ